VSLASAVERPDDILSGGAIGASASGPKRSASATSMLLLPVGACLAMVSLVVAVLLDSPPATWNVALPIFGVGAGIVFGLGLSDLVRGRHVRFARGLIAAGLLWSLSALTASAMAGLASVGHVAQWLVQLSVIYLLLAYPSGRLLARADRAMFAAGVALVGLLWIPTALIAYRFPQPSLWSTCTSTCPHNAFAIAHSTPTLVPDLVVPVREALTVALFAVVAGTVAVRWLRAGPLQGQLYAPIAAIAVLELFVFGIYFPLRTAAPGSWAVLALGWANVLLLPAVALACGAGRLYGRMFAASALDRLARNVRASTTAAGVRHAMAGALEDPSLQVLHSFPGDFGAWVDEAGRPVALLPDAQQEITEVASGSWRIALVHDPALAENRSLMQTAASYALSALENDRLSGDLRSSLLQLAESRARGIAAEGLARRKIERDLHDGAQQRLVAVRIKLRLAAEDLERRDPGHAAVIRALEDDIDATIDEVRGLARGIYPPLLDQTGLRDALREMGRLSALPTTVQSEAVGRYPAAIETAVYFSCSEALQNAAKHAVGATEVIISVWRDDDLKFEVRDDGAGFDPTRTPHGSGLNSIQDRLGAVNGKVKIRSSVGRGTTVTGAIPIA
jgi:signal transduction histidine kinase